MHNWIIDGWKGISPIAVFLTHINIQQMLTWLPTWKAKSFYCIDNFLPTWFFLPLQKFITIKIKLEKNSYTQTNACLLHISMNFKVVNISAQIYMLYSLSSANCKQLRKCNHLYRSLLFAMFFFSWY